MFSPNRIAVMFFYKSKLSNKKKRMTYIFDIFLMLLVNYKSKIVFKISRLYIKIKFSKNLNIFNTFLISFLIYC